jgi:hypothetical protein
MTWKWEFYLLISRKDAKTQKNHFERHGFGMQIIENKILFYSYNYINPCCKKIILKIRKLVPKRRDSSLESLK